MDYESLGMRIRRARKAAGMTQADLAEKLNYSDKSISKWERGDSDPSTSNLLALAKLFGISAEELLRNVGSPEHETGSE